MIVIFGASSDIGKRTTVYLLDAGLPVRAVSQDSRDLDPRAQYFKGDASDAAKATLDADVVISCAHARHTAQILAGLGSADPRLVLVGSAWRYSQVYELRRDEVVEAESVFTSSGRDGVMLHPTMIYGGTQENNLRRLLNVIRRWPVLPMPGGGSNFVQPIYVDDVALSIVAAATREWDGPHAFPISGPTPMPWRDMIRLSATAMGYRRFILPVPLKPAIMVLKQIERFGLRAPIDSNVLLRFRENVSFTADEMREHLGVVPRNFEIGLRQVLSE